MVIGIEPNFAQFGGSARGFQGLSASLAAWRSGSQPWQADGQALCISQPAAQSRAEGALEISQIWGRSCGLGDLGSWRGDGTLTVGLARGRYSPTWPCIQVSGARCACAIPTRPLPPARHPRRPTMRSPPADATATAYPARPGPRQGGEPGSRPSMPVTSLASRSSASGTPMTMSSCHNLRWCIPLPPPVLSLVHLV